jgi:hypothetical protein
MDPSLLKFFVNVQVSLEYVSLNVEKGYTYLIPFLWFGDVAASAVLTMPLLLLLLLWP